MADITSGAEQQGWAQVLPDYNQGLLQRFDHYEMLNEQHRKEKEAKAKADAARKNALGKYLGDVFDNKDYLTGNGDYDPAITNDLSGALAKYADLLKKNPDTELSDILPGIQRDASMIAQKSAKIKALNKEAEQAALALKPYGIDVNNFKKLYLDEAAHKLDANGNKVLKTPDEIDETEPYATNVLQKHADLLYNDNGAWKKELGEIKDRPTAKKVNIGGVESDRKWVAPLYDFQTYATDKEGNPMLDTNNKPYIVNPIDKDGLLNKDVYNRLSGSMGMSIKLQSELAKENRMRVAAGKQPIEAPEAVDAFKRLKAAEIVKTLTPQVDLVENKYSQAQLDKWNNAAAVRAAKEAAKSGDDTSVNDLYGRIADKMKGLDSKRALLMNQLASDEQNTIVDIAKKSGFDDASYDNMFLYKSPSGEIQLYKVDENEKKTPKKQYLITSIPKVGLNLKVQPNSDAKVEVVKQGEKPNLLQRAKKKIKDTLGLGL